MIKIEDYFSVMALEYNGKAVTAAENGVFTNGDICDRKGQGDSLTTLEGETKKLPYPKSIFFIIGFVFCERFNFLGMHTVQILYFTDKLMFDKDTATVLFHTFTTMVYFMCILGAILSDCFLGKFKTILYLSLVYTLGSVIVAFGAVPVLNFSGIATTAIGLLMVAIGSGAISPCIPAFGGDQFKLPAQSTQIASFFSGYYFATCSASVIASFLTPILRQDVHCFNDDDCYSLAFGVAGISMIVSILLFVSGKRFYRNNPPSGNSLVEVTKCIKHAIATKGREKKTKPREHWLDYSEEKFGKQLVAESKILLKVLVLFIALPLFWSLLSQQGSRWTFQAQSMDGDIGFYEIKPDQMKVVTPLLVMLFIPLFDIVIYPLLARIGIRGPLQKMTVGLLLAALAFLLSAILQLQLDKIHPIQPTEVQLQIINGSSCNTSSEANILSMERFGLNQLKMSDKMYIEVRATAPTSMSMLWQLPQYIVMTTADVMFVLTGYEFSYTQAPASMKSVLQACYLTTISIGNIIVMIIAGARIFESQANEFFLFAGLMVLDMLVFMVLAKNYNSSGNQLPDFIPSTAESIGTVDVSLID